MDRTTIYRMLDAGDLPGIKVGGRWRFPERAITRWLESAGPSRVPVDGEVPVQPDLVALAPGEGTRIQPPSLSELVSAAHLQIVQDGFATAVGVSSIVTDLKGTPITEISNASALCHLGHTSPEFRRRCAASWVGLADAQEKHPQVHLCHAGICHAVAPIHLNGTPIALVVAGQFWTSRPEPGQIRGTAIRLANECGLPASKLIEAMDSIPVLDHQRALAVTTLLATIANILSETGFQAYRVQEKLTRVEQIVRSL